MALNFPGTPTDGQIYNGFQWDATSGVWRPVASAPSLAASSDTNIVSPASGEVLAYDGANWVNQNSRLSNNAVINGDFGVWQRGTSSSGAGNGDFLADRWAIRFNGNGDGTMTYTQESFSPADIETIGYGDAQHFARIGQTVSGTSQTFFFLEQKIEDVRTFAGQEITISFWAKSSSFTGTLKVDCQQNFGSGGSSTVTTDVLSDVPVNSSWTRYSGTVTLDSLSGKTIGSSSFLNLRILANPSNEGDVLDLWGVQLEAGSVATPFKLAGGGSKAAELALCQRYFIAQTSGSTTGRIFAWCFSTTSARAAMYLPVEMRIAPTLTLPSGLTNILRNTGGLVTPSAVTVAGGATGGVISLNFTVSGVTSNEIFATTFTEASLDAEL